MGGAVGRLRRQGEQVAGYVAYAVAIGLALLSAPASLWISALVPVCDAFGQTASRDAGALTTSGHAEDGSARVEASVDEPS